MTHHDLIIGWLNDAHAMELGIVQVLERHAASAADYPQVQAGIQKHLEQTRQHAELVKGCVERLGGDTSAMKSGMASVMGAIQGMTTMVAEDDVLKNALHDYGTEHFEIACYTSLRAAAEANADRQTAQVAEQILRDEQMMADQLLQLIPTLTNDMLAKEASAVTA
jgi:ferritin-like metal-binding protein YciE